MSRFDERFLDQLKARLRPSDVIGKSVKLRRQGREYAGLSPFGKEKSPSFFVNDEKGFYHCFSSGKHGDVIDFLVETERLTFVEAVERLAAEAGMSIPAASPQAAEQERQRASLTDWLNLAAAWFEAELRRPAGAAARAYLEKRGLPESEWSRFRIGFAPSGRTGLKDYLIAKGAKPGELVAAGVLVDEENGTAPYDRFRDRIIFPITDPRGRIVSFGGRAMNPEAKAKYLNGSETAVFDKGRVLYGLADALKILRASPDGAALVVVEGYMDVIACQRAGIAAVAPMGTALTEEQMALLWRHHPEPTLCFDGDGAGQRAASRAIDRALPLLAPNRSFKFAMPVGGKDPDDVLRDQGAEALRAQMAKTRPFVYMLFDREHVRTALSTPEEKSGLRTRLRDAARAIQHADLGRDYRAEFDRRCNDLFAVKWQGPKRPGARIMPLNASDELKAATQAMRHARPTVDAILAKAEVTPEESALFDLLTQQEDVERQIQALKADFGAVGASEAMRVLVAERRRLAEAVRAARFSCEVSA